MKEIHTNRFKDAPWFTGDKEEFCIVGGAGGIGSWLTILLSRAGYLPIVYDFDILEEHNLAGQLYPKEAAKAMLPKVEALKELCKSLTDTVIDVFNEKYTAESMSHHYVFSAFDNMQARKDMFSAWCDYIEQWKKDVLSGENPSEDPDYMTHTPIFIDGRLTAEQMQIFCVTPDKIDAYKEHLFDDSEVEDAPCTLKQTSHSAAMIASHMVGFFTNHYTNNVVGDIDRNVPFKWEYFIPINYIEEIT